MLAKIHTAVIIVWTVASTTFFGLTVILAALLLRSTNICHRIARVWARSILLISRVRVTVKGVENLDPARSYIFMSNHQSNFDIPVLLAFLPVQFRWIAKSELFKIPIFGRGMRGAGYISIDRSNRRSAIESLQKAARRIQEGASVVIFPEGTRSLDGEIKPFKKGGFVLAVDAGVPVVPIAIHGTYDIMPKDHWLIHAGEVILDIKEPIPASAFTRKTKDELMDCVRRRIFESFEQEHVNFSEVSC